MEFSCNVPSLKLLLFGQHHLAALKRNDMIFQSCCMLGKQRAIPDEVKSLSIYT